MPQHLGRLDYRVGLAGKVHVKPAKAFPFEKIGGFDSSCVRNPTKSHDCDAIQEFFVRDTQQPFCLVVALVEPHVPWVMGDASKYPPKRIKLPPNLADTPRTRIDYGRYLAEITYMDSQVGDILKALDESGRADDTLVLFTSEQGSQFPGCKWTNWDTGLHTALIARWPGQVAAGQRTNAMVQYADVLPTLIELAGDQGRSPTLDGTSFLPVLLGDMSTHRQFTYGVHNNIPEGPPYPIRTVFDGQFRYIRNLRPEQLYIEKHLMGMTGGGGLNNPYWATWIAESWNNPATYRLVRRYMQREAEQLYHTAEDPYELANVAGDPKHAQRQSQLRAELDRWMKQQGDPGAAEDTHAAIHAARQGQHLYFPGKSPEPAESSN
jgi:uncharacterized sulfatase